MGSYSDMTGFNFEVKAEHANLVQRLMNFSNLPEVKHIPGSEVEAAFRACLAANNISISEDIISRESPTWLFYKSDIEEAIKPELKVISVDGAVCVKNYACLLLACIVAKFALSETWITFEDGVDHWGYTAGPDGVYALDYTVKKGDKIA